MRSASLLVAVCLVGLAASASAQFQTNFLIFTDSACTGAGTAFTGLMVNNLPACRPYGAGGSKAFCVPAGTPGAPDGNAEINLYSNADCTGLSGGVNNAKPNDGVCYASGEDGKWLKFTSCVASSGGGSIDTATGGSGGGSVIVDETDSVTITTSGRTYSDATCATSTFSFSASYSVDVLTGDYSDRTCVPIGTRYAEATCSPGDVADEIEAPTGSWEVEFFSNADCTGYLGRAAGDDLTACAAATVSGENIYVKVDGCVAAAATIQGSIATVVAIAIAFVATKMQL